MIEQVVDYHARHKDLFFVAKRGLLDYLLYSTWEYRWDYHRDLFRTDRRPRTGDDGESGENNGGVNTLRLFPFTFNNGRRDEATYIAFHAPRPAAPAAPKRQPQQPPQVFEAEGAWDAADTGLVTTTQPLLFGFRPIGDVVEATRADCSDQVLNMIGTMLMCLDSDW